MYKIALCDDEPAELEKTQAMLAAYQQARPKYELTVWPFSSVSSMLAEFDKGNPYDILFLDIYLPNENGMQAAERLRASNIRCPIIFLTTSLDHAVDAFRVEATHYLVKPVAPNELFTAVDKAINHIAKERGQFIVLKVDGEIRKMPLKQIVYCEAQGNYQCLNLTDGTRLRTRLTMTQLFGLMENEPQFIRMGIAYIINLSHVDSLTSQEVCMDSGKALKIPRRAYPIIKEQYFGYYCRRLVL